MNEINDSGKTFEGLRFFLRSLLYLSIGLLLICSFLTLLVGTVDNFAFNYFSIYISTFTLLFSILLLSGVALYKTIKNESSWAILKKEVILCMTTCFGLMLLGLITNYIAK